MAGQALYLKYRPRVFDDMIGQEPITRTLRNALAQNRLRHAYLFSGPRGTGKTTMARILSKAVNCTFPDVNVRPCDVCEACVAVNEGRYLDLIEIDAASNNGVDDVRELRDKIGFAPNEGKYKIYVIDEVHRFSPAAFDALLKTLEEPPDHAIFILATTEIEKVPATIKSRCLKFEFRRVSTTEVADRLQLIAEYEGLTVDRDALELIARQGTGSVRDSISLLDQIVVDPDERITLTLAESILGTAKNQSVRAMVDALIESDVARGLDILNAAIDEGADPRQFGGQILEYLREVMLTQTAGPSLVEASDDQREIYKRQASAISRGMLVRAVKLFNTALGEMKSSWQPQLPLELALIESTRPQAEEVPAQQAARPAPVKSKVRRAEAVVEPVLEDEPAVEGVASIQAVRRQWPEIIALIRSNDNYKPLAAKLAHTEPKTVEGDVLVLALTNLPLMNSLTDEKSRGALAAAIRKIMGVALKIKIVPSQSAGNDDTELPADLADFRRETGAVVHTESQD